MFIPRTLITRKVLLCLVLLIVFLIRLRYGQTKYSGQDEIQIYLIGLKFYTTGIFPFWGADAGGTGSQIPGGLQGLLVGLPFFCRSVPESPYFLLNALSFGAILYFAWYLRKRLPDVPAWFIYAWLFSAPWLLHYSTHIENPSYVLFGAVLFFTGAFELLPIYSKKILPQALAFFQLGFALCWIMQLHLSWVLLLPYIAGSFYFGCKNRRQFLSGMLFFITGATISAAALIPVLIRYSDCFSGGIEQNVRFHPENLLEFYTVFARVLSFACYELPRFIGHNTASRLDFLSRTPWVIPVAAVLFLAGIVQFIWLALAFFRRQNYPEWQMVKYLMLFSILITCLGFCFSRTTPSSHAYYLLLPVAMWYSFYCYAGLFHKKFTSRIILILLSFGVVFHLALALDNDQKIGLRQSREKIIHAIEQQDYTFAGLRRAGKLEGKNREYIWKTGAAENGRLIAFTSFEYQDAYFKPQNIVKNEAFSGRFSCKIDSIQPYSTGFEIALDELKKSTHVQLSCLLKATAPNDLMLVQDIRLDSQMLHWNGVPALDDDIPAGEWQKMQFKMEIPPDLHPKARLSLYFWLPSKNDAVTYIDEVKIEFGT